MTAFPAALRTLVPAASEAGQFNITCTGGFFLRSPDRLATSSHPPLGVRSFGRFKDVLPK